MGRPGIITRIKLWLAEKLAEGYLESYVEARIVEYKDALRWCSGSADFHKGGQAYLGWKKIAHLLE